MASSAPQPPRPPRVGRDAGDAEVSPVPPDVAHRVLLVAHEVAQETLADAQRLAAGVLLEAGRQAEALVGEASDAAARSAAQHAAATVAEAINIRHNDIVSVLAQVRDELRSVCEALPQGAPLGHSGAEDAPRHPPTASGRRPSLLAADPDVALSPSDEEFLEELYRRIAGTGASRRREAILTHPDDRVVAVRASARRSAERAAAERAAIQAEALERQAMRRRTRSIPTGHVGERRDVVFSMADRRPAAIDSKSI